MGRLRVGDGGNSTNPRTALPEFFFKNGLAKLGIPNNAQSIDPDFTITDIPTDSNTQNRPFDFKDLLPRTKEELDMPAIEIWNQMKRWRSGEIGDSSFLKIYNEITHKNFSSIEDVLRDMGM